jgi:hypothetical protein
MDMTSTAVRFLIDRIANPEAPTHTGTARTPHLAAQQHRPGRRNALTRSSSRPTAAKPRGRHAWSTWPRLSSPTCPPVPPETEVGSWQTSRSTWRPPASSQASDTSSPACGLLADEIGAEPASTFYGYLNGAPSADQAPAILRAVTLRLRAEYRDWPTVWAPLIHSGP